MQYLSNNKALYSLKISGLLYMVATFVMAIYYLQERTFYIDSGAQIFGMILSDNFDIFVNRYSMYVHQFLPMTAIWLGAPLVVVALLYSLATPIITLVCLYLCLYTFKNIEAAFAIIITGVLSAFTFFHGISESMQLMPYAAVFYASLHSYLRKQSVAKFLFTTVVLLLTYFIHPASVLLLGFAFLIVFLDKFKYWKVLLPFVITLVVVFLGKTILTLTGVIAAHDSGFFKQLLGNIKSLPHLFSFRLWMQFVERFFKLYALLFALGIIGLIVRLRRKDYLHTALESAAILLVFIITMLMYKDGDFEIGVIPFAFFVALFVRKELERLANSSVMYLTALIPIVFIGNTVRAGSSMLSRSEFINTYINLAQDAEGKKFYISPTPEELKNFDLQWGLAIESILRSSLLSSSETVTLYPNTQLIVPIVLDKVEPVFNHVPWWPHRYDDELNRTGYFELSGITAPLINWSIVDTITFTGALKTNAGQVISDDKRVIVLSSDLWVNNNDTVNTSLNLALPSGEKGFVFDVVLNANTDYVFGANNFVNKNILLAADTDNGTHYEVQTKESGLLKIATGTNVETYHVYIQNKDTTMVYLNTLFLSK